MLTYNSELIGADKIGVHTGTHYHTPQFNRSTALQETALLETITAGELAAQFAEHGTGLSEAQLSQTRISLGSLFVAPMVFQPRNMDEKSWEKSKHIGNLAKIAGHPKQELHAIVVFPIAGAWIVIDGHCRLEAYRKAKAAKAPVKRFRGTFAEALAHAAASNSKDKLALSYWEKAEMAWRLVKFSEAHACYSQRDISRDTGVSKSTIQKMQIRLLEVDADAVRPLSWAEVLKMSRPEPERNDDWRDKLAKEWAERLRKTFGDKPNTQPEVWQQALQQAYGQDRYGYAGVTGEDEQEETSDF
jgi:hypothetical protein